MLKVYALNINEAVSESEWVELTTMVSKECRASSSRFRHENDRRRSIYGEALVRYLAILHQSQKQVTIGRTVFGKPYFVSGSSFHFNLSHGGEWLVCAWSTESVGIDVEECVCENFELSIARDFFHKSEYETICKGQSASEQLALFYQFWTLKESYLKYLGNGLAVDLNAFAVSLSDKACQLPTLSEGTLGEPLFFHQEKIDETHQLALCSREKYEGKPIRVSISRVSKLLKSKC